MYEKYFSLDELPFDGLTESRFYYVGNCQHQALELLTNNLSRNGSICVLSGPSGSGKTTLVRMLIRSLPKRMRIIAIDDPRLNEHMLLATILRASGVVATSFESIAELTLKLRKLLEHSVESGIVTTVICDEAQGLSDDVIEQIRLISNIKGSLGKMINFLLVGQEDLISNIQKPMHKMFWGRVKAFASIKALKRDEVQAYVTFRMQIAGCHDPIFTNRAISALYKSTGGLPRLINSIADRALCIAFEAQKKYVSSSMVKKATKVVRYERSLFVLGFKSFIKDCLLTVFAKIPLMLLGMAISVGIFSLAYFYLPHRLDSQSLTSLVQKDRFVESEYDKALKKLLPASSKESKELYLFNESVNQSLFLSDSLNTLIKVWGYKRADGSKATCNDLDKVNLKCTTIQGELSLLKLINRPSVLLMRSDKMVPYYALIKSINDKESEIILGDKLWRVKTAYIEKYFDGEFTFISYKVNDDLSKAFDDIKTDNYKKSLLRIQKALGESLESSLSNKKDLIASYKAFSSKNDEDIANALIDNALNKGAYLEK
ncbi:MAG: Flp pilus assembly complex ATPase component TadA [Aeromonadales bacterium]|nr:Flp pilus assembly complex ATPase component TadA [Aeromonadales bacterium]